VFFHVVPYLGEKELYESSAEQGKQLPDKLPWNNQLYEHPISTFVCPSDPSADARGMTDVGWAAGSYASNGQVFATIDPATSLVRDWNGAARIPASFPQGTSNAIMLAEKYARCHEHGTLWARWEKDYWQPTFAAWTVGPGAMFQVHPTPFLTPNCDATRPSTAHPRGIHVALADASVRSLSPRFSPRIWWTATSHEGASLFPGESADEDWNVFGPHRR